MVVDKTRTIESDDSLYNRPPITTCGRASGIVKQNFYTTLQSMQWGSITSANIQTHGVLLKY